MTFDQITPKLFLGSCPKDTKDIDRLKNEIGVTTVLNLQTDEDLASWRIDWDCLEEHYTESGIEAHRLPITDFDSESLRRGLPACVEVLHLLMKKDRTVYVHCSGGIGRSPTVVVAYLYWSEGRDLDEAAAHVMKCRSCNPHVDTIQQATEDMARKNEERE